MRKVALALMAIAACGWAAFAQADEPIVTVKVVPSAELFSPGQSYPLTLEIAIRSPFHINADIPSEDYLIGTTVNFQSVPGVTFGKIAFPLAETPFSRKVPGEGSSEGVTPAASAPVNKEIPVSPENPQASAKKMPEDTQAFPEEAEKRTPDPPPAVQGTAKPASRFEGKGLLPLFLLVFLGGLALNLPPCVYPPIPITISYFGGQSGGKRGGLVLHAVLYVVGMAITYSVLGSIAAFTGSLFGAALQYPLVLVFIALIMILLSLSMFDVYELRMPAFLSRLASGSQKGYLGTLFMGLTVGIVAATCIGPFVLGLLTYVGNRGSVVLGFSLFFVLALGLGIPFLFLGVFSGSLNKLPRSGGWVVWVRQVFGFILVAMAIYFLRPLFPTSLLYHLALALTMFIAGIYMAWLEPTQTPGKVFRYARTAVGIIFFAVALFPP